MSVKRKNQRIRKSSDEQRIIAELERPSSRLKPAEDALNESMEKYHIHFSLTDDVLYSVDTRLRLTSISPSIENVLGYKPEDLVGRSFPDLNLLHPDDLSKAVTDSLRILSGENIPSSIYRFVAKDGTQKFGEVRSAPYKQDGHIVGIIALGRDITRMILIQKELMSHRDHLEDLVRKRTTDLMEANEKLTREVEERIRAETALRESQAIYRLLVDNASEAIFVAQDGVLRFVNPECMAISGYTKDELNSRPFIDFIHPVDREKVADRHQRRMKGEEIPGVYSFRIIDKNGNIKWVEINAVLIPWNGSLAALTFLVDITERKRMEDKLKNHCEHLEALVKDRTSDLIKANELLGHEIKIKEATETILRSREIELERKQQNLEEMNFTLRVLLQQREKDKATMEENIMENIKVSVLPYLEKLKDSGLKEKQMIYFSEVEVHLKEIASSFIRKLSSEYIGLSPSEIRVASLIKEGKSSKEIARILNVSIHTVDYHRFFIRKKSGLKGRKINLRSYLQTLIH